jgi:hypothetical protein
MLMRDLFVVRHMIWHSSKWYSCSLIQHILNLREVYNLEKSLQENGGNMSGVFSR